MLCNAVSPRSRRGKAEPRPSSLFEKRATRRSVRAGASTASAPRDFAKAANPGIKNACGRAWAHALAVARGRSGSAVALIKYCQPASHDVSCGAGRRAIQPLSSESYRHTLESFLLVARALVKAIGRTIQHKRPAAMGRVLKAARVTFRSGTTGVSRFGDGQPGGDGSGRAGSPVRTLPCGVISTCRRCCIRCCMMLDLLRLHARAGSRESISGVSAYRRRDTLPPCPSK